MEHKIFAIALEGFGLGISVGGYCLSSCAPFFLPYILGEGKLSARRAARSVVSFMLGRLSAYLLFSSVASFSGVYFKDKLPPQAASWGLIFLSLLMIVFTLSRARPGWHFCLWFQKYFNPRFPFLLGFFLGLNACPPFLAGLARLFELGNIFLCAVFFISFFLSTSLYFLPVIFLGPRLSKIADLQWISGAVALLVGIWFLAIGLGGLF